MSIEHRSSRILIAYIEPSMPDRDRRSYREFVKRVVDLPMGSRYMAMEARKLSCFQAVDVWKKLQPVLDEWVLGGQWFIFDRRVRDKFGYFETGQDMLSARLSGSDNILVADVAGYLFGFSYNKMLIAAGPYDYVARKVTQHYSKKYPDIVVTAGESE